MKNKIVPFSHIRQSAIKAVDDDYMLKLVRKTITPQNIVDIFSINTFCFYANKTFGIFYNDFIKINHFLKTKFSINISEDFPSFPNDYSVIEVESGEDIIHYFKEINMNQEDSKKQRYGRENNIRHMEVDYSLLNFSSLKNKRILCVDIEVQTENFDITEMGITFIDKGTIETRHFLIKEFKDLKKERKNRQDFFNFGQSELLSIQQMKDVLIDYLERSDCFMAHSIHAENHYLRQIDVHLIEYINEFIDTQSFHKLMYNDFDPISLENLLVKLDIPFSYLHNSGNDAFYTWQAFLYMLTQKVNFFSRKTSWNEKNEAFAIIGLQ